ncbi:MAG: hypothetical protein ACKOAD_01175, partial [Gammaproteobacteria bacterium]
MHDFFGFLKISGPENTVFLQGQLPCDVQALSTNHSTITAYCNNQGRILSVLRIYKLLENSPDNFYYLLRLPQSLLSLIKIELEKYGQFSDIHIEAIHNLSKIFFEDL